MKINYHKDGSLDLAFSPKETKKFLDRCLLSNTHRSIRFFYSLYFEIEETLPIEQPEKALPIFILAGNKKQATAYIKKNKIRNPIVIQHTNQLFGQRKIEIHYVGNWYERSDLVGMGCILRGSGSKKDL